MNNNLFIYFYENANYRKDNLLSCILVKIKLPKLPIYLYIIIIIIIIIIYTHEPTEISFLIPYFSHSPPPPTTTANSLDRRRAFLFLTVYLSSFLPRLSEFLPSCLPLPHKLDLEFCSYWIWNGNL